LESILQLVLGANMAGLDLGATTTLSRTWHDNCIRLFRWFFLFKLDVCFILWCHKRSWFI